MNNIRFRLILSAVCLVSIMMSAIKSNAAPVQFNQVFQVINASPGKAATGGFAQLRLADENSVVIKDGDDKKTAPPQQDERVITETRAEIMENDVCDCESPYIATRRFPYALLGLGAIPFLFLIPRKKRTPTPTPTPPTTETPTPETTPTPGTTPTPVTTPTPGTTPTPDTTPTPPMTTPTPPEPVPEPMTILLFGSGLASIGLAARRKLGKKDADDASETEE